MINDLLANRHDIDFNYVPSGPSVGAIVCTIEKANLVVNKMLEEDSLGQLGALVVDELHMVGDDDRCENTN